MNVLLRRLMVLAGMSASIYAINRLLFIPWFPEGGFHNRHLGDLLALPVYLPLSIYLAWRLDLIPEDFQLTPRHIVAAALIFSVLFEGLIPMVDATAIGDPRDILAYFAGGLLVYGAGHPPRRKQIAHTQD